MPNYDYKMINDIDIVGNERNIHNHQEGNA